MNTESPDSQPASLANQPWPALQLPQVAADPSASQARNSRPFRQLESSLDPDSWTAYYELATEELAHLVEHLSRSASRPVWQPVPVEVKTSLESPLPWEPQPAEQVCQEIRSTILPWCLGNTHPRFFGWVHGTGTAGGMLAEMFAGAMNANVGGREHAPIYVERAVVEWCRQIFGFPGTASGLLLSGTSMATLVALSIARNHLAPIDLRQEGIAGLRQRMIVYTSAEAHCSIVKAVELLGLGRKSLRSIPVNHSHQMDLDQLKNKIQSDRKRGDIPFCVVGTAGTVDVAAVDDLNTLATICGEERLWFHVDGAFGAWAVLSDDHRFLLRGIERADSIAFDFHKWMHVPYDAGCLLVRDEEIHRRAFAIDAAYLTPGEAAAKGNPWYCDFGPELSRGFRALKVWFTLKEHGLKRLGQKVADNCQQACFLRECVIAHPDLELLAPVQLNIVCFRYSLPGYGDRQLDSFNSRIVNALQSTGVAVASTTRIRGRLAIRVNITNHRTTINDLLILIETIEHLATDLLDGHDAFPASRKTHVLSNHRSVEPADSPGSRIDCILNRPEMQPLARQFTIRARQGLELPMRMQSDLVIEVDAGLLESDIDGPVLVRQALEILALKNASQDESPIGQVVRSLCAFDTAMKYRRFHFPLVGVEYGPPGYLPPLCRRIVQDPAGATACQLEQAVQMLLPWQGSDTRLVRQLSARDWTIIQDRLREFQSVLGPSEFLVTTGGDTRLEIDAATGISKYGCHRVPQPRLVSFGSSTATSLTPDSLVECERVRQQLVAASLNGQLPAQARSLTTQIRQQIRQYCGAEDLPGTEVILCSSGTDAELIATCLFSRSSHLPLTNILVAPSESGSGLPLAANGYHYDSLSPSGARVKRGQSLLTDPDVQIRTVAVHARDTTGRLRPATAIHRQIEHAVAAAVEQGNCLLHVLATSKTGWQFPDNEFVGRLKQQHGERLKIIVDACQLRQHPGSLREHLQAGYLVQLTGSKTFGGPPFSGALLVPAMFAGAFSEIQHGLEGLCHYSTQSEWPADWQLTRQILNRACNPGLILRWSAAAREMQRFNAIPDALKTDILTKLAGSIGESMFRSAVVSPLTDCCSDRPQGWPNPPWENVQTIFPFRLKHADCNSDGAWLTHSEMQSVHRLLNRDLTASTSDAARCQTDSALGLRFQIGQPVQLGQGGRSPVNVLRICLGAHVVSRVVFGGLPGQSIAQRIKQEQHRIEQVFHKIQTILDNWSQWQPVDAARVSGRPEHAGGFPCESVKLAR